MKKESKTESRIGIIDKQIQMRSRIRIPIEEDDP